MGYLKISNLYRAQEILLFKECYCLEKVHGTSAHIAYDNGTLTFFSGEQQENFEKLFNKEELKAKFEALGIPKVRVHGELYGGKIQGMSATYGKDLKFIVFDILTHEGKWLNVPEMDFMAKVNLGLKTVPWKRISTDIKEVDAERDAFSIVAERNGMGNDKQREGIVLRPLTEMFCSNGRVISKHKAETFNERRTHQKIDDPAKLLVLNEAKAIAEEWVVEERLNHILQRVQCNSITEMKTIVQAMIEDIYVEAKGEIVESKDVERAIGHRTVHMFKERLNNQLRSPIE